jgi:hypothetical protein
MRRYITVAGNWRHKFKPCQIELREILSDASIDALKLFQYQKCNCRHCLKIVNVCIFLLAKFTPMSTGLTITNFH